MIPGLAGSLLSQDALEQAIPDALRSMLDESGRGAARRRMHAWHAPLRVVLGPASGPRTIFDRLATPLMAQLGYRVVPDATTPRAIRALLEAKGRVAATLLVTGWGQDVSSAWRDAVRQGIEHGVRWCFCFNGSTLRIVDGRRTYSRQFVEFDVASAISNDATFAVLWGLLRADAMSIGAPDPRTLLERAIALSDVHRSAVRTSLQSGVDEALMHLLRAFGAAAGRRRARTSTAAPSARFDEALVVIYRILFLLFAEARGLVPGWHPIYRDGYTIESLRQPVELLPRPRGLWEAIQSIARLAHRGCRVGTLNVTPFNGRLFSPSESPLADTLALDDGAVRQALLALTTRPRQNGRERIAYGDLGVEQLGGVYERVLDLEPAAPGEQARLVRSHRRKATGSFYTPRSLTEHLVRRTLAPLVHDVSPSAILALRVLDPAMGSGAFLVAACRHLASAYEAALVRAGDAGAVDITERDRAGFRRIIAQRCLYGVDLNPMAVQLGRLSLWLATLAADRPLTFLDHRLRSGNSLVGCTPADLTRQPGSRSRTGAVALPLFDDPRRDTELEEVVAIRDAIATEPGDTLAQVRAKERALSGVMSADTPLTRWKQACDLWCAAWFLDRKRAGRLPVFSALVDAVLGRGGLPDHVVAPIVDDARAVASRERFFHWTFEFPEAFGSTAGFDAVIGNPPWEMLRGDQGDAASRETARVAASALLDFARGSGVYALQGSGHGNLYLLFLERMLSLVRRNGRIGVVLPSGFATDHGAAGLRRVMLERSTIDALIAIENRDGVFPVHRGLKFLLLTATTGGQTKTLPCRFGLRRPESLDALPEIGPDPQAINVTRSLLLQVTGPDLAIPDIRSQQDVDLVTRIAFGTPALGDRDGWHVHFGRELNATDDRRHFKENPSAWVTSDLPVIEGKQVTPFQVDTVNVAARIPEQVAAALLDAERTFKRARLAYRDVASATNRLTLIAAIVPRGVVTTHTLFCLKDRLDEREQLFLLAMFNSYVANYLIRLRVNTHVTTAIIDRLPMPKPGMQSSLFREVAGLSAAILDKREDGDARARIQGLAARLYDLDRAQFQHVLGTFPLVPREERDGAMAAFCGIVT